MGILTARVYESLNDVREAQSKYERFKKEGVHSEHFYQKISDKYGKDFPEHVQALINSLPGALNIDKEQLTLDSLGIGIVDEAIHWNHNNYKSFDTWFPCVLAYYAQCYLIENKTGSWAVRWDTESKVWIPYIKLQN